jgi:hypothetical protein
MQQYYYVPHGMLQPMNELVFLEELGVSDLSLVTIALSVVQVP